MLAPWDCCHAEVDLFLFQANVCLGGGGTERTWGTRRWPALFIAALLIFTHLFKSRQMSRGVLSTECFRVFPIWKTYLISFLQTGAWLGRSSSRTDQAWESSPLCEWKSQDYQPISIWYFQTDPAAMERCVFRLLQPQTSNFNLSTYFQATRNNPTAST